MRLLTNPTHVDEVQHIISVARGYRTQKNLAMAYVDPQHAAEGAVLEVLLIGKPVRASVRQLCLFDPLARVPQGHGKPDTRVV